MDTINLISQPVRLSLRDVLFVVFCKKHIFAGTFLIVVVLTMGMAFIVSPIYEVSSTILLKPFIDPGLQLQTMSGIRAMPVGVEDINSEVNIMNSEELLRKVVVLTGPGGKGPKHAFIRAINAVMKTVRGIMIWVGISTRADPVDVAVKRLGSDLKIEPVTASSMIRISMRGDDPIRITQVLNTFIEAYIDHHIEVHKAKGGLNFYARQAELYVHKLNQSENALKEFQKKWSLIEIDGQQNENVALLKILRQALSQIRGKIAEKQTKVAQLKENMDSDSSPTAMTEELRGSAAIIELTRALVPLMVEKERIALLYPESSVEYQDAMNQAKRFEGEVEKIQKQILAGIELDRKALSSHAKTLLTEINSIEEESRFLMEKKAEREKLLREMAQNEKNAILYQDKTEEARINEQKDEARVANVSVSNYPHVPSMPVFPKKILMGIAAIILGLIAGAGCAFAAYYLDHTIKRPEDLEQHCGLQVLASLPQVDQPPPAGRSKGGFKP